MQRSTRLVAERAAAGNSTARRRAVVVLAAIMWSGSGAPVQAKSGSCLLTSRQPYAPHAFLGFACRDGECAAHKSGFAWADRFGITAAKDCLETDDAGFAEGCRAFVEDVVTAEQSGFAWARENELVDDCLCRGAGPRFEAGCEAYVAGFGR
jgi:hypothetical protein